MQGRRWVATALVWAAVLWACNPHPATMKNDLGGVRQKIAFDLEAVNDEGLRGGPGAYRSVGYEFCIPADPAILEAVATIDPTLACHKGSPGRVGCTGDRWLCMGNTHQPGFRDVLMRLAGLPYVQRIEESHYE